MQRKLTVLLGLLLMLAACALPANPFSTTAEVPSDYVTTADSAHTEAPVELVSNETGLELHVLDVGQGLCVLIGSEGHWLLYDAGGTDSSDNVIRFLSEKGVVSLDAMVVSHYDEDHTGGCAAVLRRYRAERIYCPDYEAESAAYEILTREISRSGAACIHPGPGEMLQLGSAEVRFLAPDNCTNRQENDCSLVIQVRYLQRAALLMGDAEYQEEQELLECGEELQSDILIAGHHGSAGSTSRELLTAVKPQAVLISCGTGNEYGHPSEQTMTRIRVCGAQMYRTDLQGTISMETDGTDLRMNLSPCSDYSPGTAAEDNPEGIYILNTRTKKFHRTDCESAEKIWKKNKKIYEGSREDLIEMGYEACGICRP